MNIDYTEDAIKEFKRENIKPKIREKLNKIFSKKKPEA